MITQENNDEDSFIILGTSPGTSLDIKCNGIENGSVSLDKEQIEEAMKDLSIEANMALKAHFNIGECPSPSSMMVASTIVTDDSSTEELQKRFGELLDENVILKETLKQNNDSMKEQFLLIASCQEDMMQTHILHKEKFEETKELVERLRQENKKLKQDVVRLAEKETSIVNSEASESVKSGPSSALEFVTSPDDDTINKLTSQLELVEKQRRQVIVDNEKLTWQKESLEHIVDATSKERDDLREKLKDAELQLSTKDTEYGMEIQNLKHIIQDLTKEMQSQRSASNITSEEVTKRDTTIQQLQAKVSILQSELKKANLKILELESVKLEFSKHKSGVSESVRTYKEQIQDLQERLKEVTTIVFQPVRFSVSSECENASEDAGLTSNVNLYDRTLKYLAELMNKLSHGIADSLVETLGVVASLYEYKLERTTVEQFRSALGEVKRQLEMQHTTALNNIAQVRGALSIFEGIFKDYNELMKKVQAKQKLERPSSAANIDALTAALVARGQELQAMEAELNKLKNLKEERDLMKEQMDLYRSDFEAEREAREKMASEKENILTELRTAQRRIKELTSQLEEAHNKKVAVNHNVVSSSSNKSLTASSKPGHWLLKSPIENKVYTCPKCLRFSSDQYTSMEEHFDFCLDDF